MITLLETWMHFKYWREVWSDIYPLGARPHFLECYEPSLGHLEAYTANYRSHRLCTCQHSRESNRCSHSKLLERCHDRLRRRLRTLGIHAGHNSTINDVEIVPDTISSYIYGPMVSKSVQPREEHFRAKSAWDVVPVTHIWRPTFPPTHQSRALPSS